MGPKVSSPTHVATLRCPNCGAPASPEATCCPYCGTALALVGCPHCFARVFEGAQHCSKCGTAIASRKTAEESAPGECPECSRELVGTQLATVRLHECHSCGGLWVDADTFGRVCAETEAQEGVLTLAERPGWTETIRQRRAYRPCLVCGQLMNRVSFDSESKIILDICRRHGVWCDGHELHAVVRYIQTGGTAALPLHDDELLAVPDTRPHSLPATPSAHPSPDREQAQAHFARAQHVLEIVFKEDGVRRHGRVPTWIPPTVARYLPVWDRTEVIGFGFGLCLGLLALLLIGVFYPVSTNLVLGIILPLGFGVAGFMFSHWVSR